MKRYLNFLAELAKQPGGERISDCLTCRVCTAGCPVSRINQRFNPFRIIQMTLLGLVEDVLTHDFIWLCAACDSCKAACPRGVRVSDVMSLLKNAAAKEGYVPHGVKAQLKILKEKGRIYDIDEFDNKKRGKLNLPALPISCDVVKTLFSEK